MYYYLLLLLFFSILSARRWEKTARGGAADPRFEESPGAYLEVDNMAWLVSFLRTAVSY